MSKRKNPKKDNEAKTVKQKDLTGGDISPEILREELVRVTKVYKASHFILKIGQSALDKLHELDTMGEREEILRRRIKPHPDVEEIPHGARAMETEQLIAAALTESN